MSRFSNQSNRHLMPNSSTLFVGGITWLLTKVNSALWELEPPKLKKKMMMSTSSDLMTKKKTKKLNVSRRSVLRHTMLESLLKKRKGKVIAKSNIILDIKPWDDETPLDKLEECVRSVTMDGLLWGTGKFVAVGYGIKKLQITCVVEDDKISTDDLED